MIEAATHRGKAEIETMLFRRLLGRPEYALAHVELDGATAGDTETREGPDHEDDAPNDTLPVDEHALAHVGGLQIGAASHSLERVSLHLAISRSPQEKLRYAQTLLSHAVPSGDPAEVLERALDALIEKVEKRRFGAGARKHRPRASAAESPRQTPATRRQTFAPRLPASALRRSALHGGSPAPNRYIPAAVRRRVWERDGGRCTFVGTNGHRCESLRFLEFDHVDPVARGGDAGVEGVRLRCRTHNQLEAERIFGTGFMGEKRKDARHERAPSGTRTGNAPDTEQLTDIQACLKGLGCRPAEARRAAEIGAALRGATLEERLRAALRSLRPRSAACRVLPG